MGHVDAGVKSNSFAAQETFRPFDSQDNFVPAYSDQPVTLETFEPRLATQSAKVRRKRPQKLEKLVEMSVDQETLSFTRHDGKPINNARDLYEYSVTLDQLEWGRMRDMAEFQTYFELRQRVSAELNARIPNGVRMPTHTMRQSMNNLTKIMDELSPSGNTGNSRLYATTSTHKRWRCADIPQSIRRSRPEHSTKHLRLCAGTSQYDWP